MTVELSKAAHPLHPLSRVFAHRVPAITWSRPALPPALSRWADAHHATVVRARLVVRRTAVWAAAVPAMSLLLVVYAPRGAWRTIRAGARYAYDTESSVLRDRHARSGDAAAYAAAQTARRVSVQARARVCAAVAAVLVAVGLTWWAPAVLGAAAGVAVAVVVLRIIPGRGVGEVLAASVAGALVWWHLPFWVAEIPAPPVWALAVTAAAAVLGLGWLGRPLGRPLVARETVPGAVAVPLSAPMVRDALCALGIGAMRDPDQLRLLTDVHRHGPGVQVDVELPAGVPATAVMDRREELAAALRRELGTVWPSVGPRHPGHLALYVADQPMAGARQTPWPLLSEGQVDLFRPQPFGTDQCGRWVDVTLAYSSAVIGAVPRTGKTFALRELLLIAALDPRARVYALDGKGTGDLTPLAPVAHYIGIGDEPDDIAEQLAVLRGLRAELRRRARVIRGLPREECPESKVTSALADRRDLGLEPIVIGVDETQTIFEYGERTSKEDKAIRDEFAAICTDLVKRGPALGFICLLATQQVNANTIPTSISNNAVIRFAMRMFGHTANDQVLGTGARKSGLDATMLGPADRGIGYLRADGEQAQIVRTVHGLDAVAAEKVAVRARAVRAAAGRLTGAAAGDGPDVPVKVDVLDDVREVMAAAGARRMGLSAILDRLLLLRPAHYTKWTNDTTGAALRGGGVAVVSVHCPEQQRSVKGVRREDLDGAADLTVDVET